MMNHSNFPKAYLDEILEMLLLILSYVHANSMDSHPRKSVYQVFSMP